MPEPFDPYLSWLGISAKDRPLTHYQLLGLDPTVSDREVIGDAADQRMAQVRCYQWGPDAALAGRVLEELAAAAECLLSSTAKAAYDRYLQREASLPDLTPGRSSRMPSPRDPLLPDSSSMELVSPDSSDRIPTLEVDSAADSAERLESVLIEQSGEAGPSQADVAPPRRRWPWILGLMAVVGMLAVVAVLAVGGVPWQKEPSVITENVPPKPPEPKPTKSEPAKSKPAEPKSMKPESTPREAPMLPPPPTIRVIADRTLDPGSELTFSVQADTDGSPGKLVFSLTDLPPGAEIDPSKGIFRWTPKPPQGGKRHTITVRVGWESFPSVFAEKVFTVTVADAKTLTNSIGMKLVLIPAGEFQMGSSEAEIKRLVGEAKAQNESAETLDRLSQEGPQHRVRISRSFYLGACEVTVGQFRAFVQAENYRTEAEKDGKGGSGTDLTTGKLAQGPRFTWQNVGRPQQDDHPVVNVTWNDCLAFCNWLSRKEQAAYRLPTEAEWEYACRAGSLGRFCFGDLDAALGEHAWFDLDLDKDVARPVAGRKPNAWGLYDVHGNVWEWCADRFGEDAYARAADDPAGPSAGSRRVVRGGGFFSRPLKCRSAFRFDEDPAGRGHYSGFRVVRSLEPAAGELREKRPHSPDKDRMLSEY